MVSWDDPRDNKGVIQRYTVHYFCVDTSHCDDERQHSTTEHNYTIIGLHPYSEYTIVISAWTVAGEGEDSKPLIITTLEAGEKPLKC